MRFLPRVAWSLAACILSGAAHGNETGKLTWTGQKGSVNLYGTFDIGYMSRWGGDNSSVVRANGIQTAAGSDGSRLGVKFNYAVTTGNTLIGDAEYGVNPNKNSESGSGGKTFFVRQAYIGLAGKWGMLLAGTMDGSRSTVLKSYDPFMGRSVASAGSMQLVVTRADNAIAYVSPTWKGITLTVGYTAELYNEAVHDYQSPVYSARIDYTHGPLRLSYDHELEWWNNLPGYTYAKVNVLGASYAFSKVTLSGYYDRTSIDRPFNVTGLGFFENHAGYMLGAKMPIGSAGMLKMSWNRRDSKYTDNTCDKWGVGYQHTLSKSTYIYGDYAVISNGSNGTCTIAYANEQTSSDLGSGDSGGRGKQGVDFGIVYQF